MNGRNEHWHAWAERMGLRPFAKEDWFGFAGAEPFADGRAPLIGELVIDGIPALVVLDAAGLSIMPDDDGEPTTPPPPHSTTRLAIAQLGIPIYMEEER